MLAWDSMGLLTSPKLSKLYRGATICGGDGLGPEGGYSLLPITVITTAMFSGNRLHVRLCLLPLIREARWFPCGGRLLARKLIVVHRQLRQENCEQALLLTSSNLLGLIHGVRQW